VSLAQRVRIAAWFVGVGVKCREKCMHHHGRCNQQAAHHNWHSHKISVCSNFRSERGLMRGVRGSADDKSHDDAMIALQPEFVWRAPGGGHYAAAGGLVN
jgi:hypothetical protein